MRLKVRIKLIQQELIFYATLLTITQRSGFSLSLKPVFIFRIDFILNTYESSGDPHSSNNVRKTYDCILIYASLAQDRFR